jgi:hypothetical protein
MAGLARKHVHCRLRLQLLDPDVWFFAIRALVWARRLPFSENGDGLLETIMSLQKVTLYYWGEDRFANLLPAATLWIRNPTDNACAQMALQPALVCPTLWQILDNSRDGR